MYQRLSRLLDYPLAAASAMAKKRLDRDTTRPGEVNEAVLFDILRRNQETEFGLRHRFARIRTVTEYRRALPVATYDHFQSYIERIARGEQGLLTADRVEYLGMTSGTTGSRKMIPLTAPMRQKQAQAGMLLVPALLAEHVPDVRRGGPSLFLIGATLPFRTEGGLLAGPATSAGMHAMLKMAPFFWTSPPEVYQAKRQADALYLHLLFTLSNRALRSIAAPFASTVLDLFHTLEERGEDLCRDLARGVLRDELDLDAAARSALAARLRPDPETARIVERELGHGASGLAKRLFPDLGWITTTTGGGFSIYASKLARYVGDLPIHSAIYGATESLIGLGLGPDRPAYVVVPSASFFEFIPEDQIDDTAPETRLLGEIQEGQRYEVVLTTRGGLYRYRLGDVVLVIDRRHRTPVLEFLYRRGGLLNIIGEKTSEDASQRALGQALAGTGLDLVDFAAHADLESTPERYVFYVELAGKSAVPDLAERFEAALAAANPMYKVFRDAGKLGPVTLRRTQAGAFHELRDVLVARGASPSQVKVPRALRDPALVQLLASKCA